MVPKAARQLEDICGYIAKDSLRYGSVFAQRVLRLVKSIPAHPEIGRIVPEYRDPALRERIYQGYRVVYRLRADAIEIVAICHGSRRIERALDPEN